MEVLRVDNDPVHKKLTILTLTRNFLSRLDKELYSPDFGASFNEDVKWFIDIEPNGQGRDDGAYVRVFLHNSKAKANDVSVIKEWNLIGSDNRILYHAGSTRVTNYRDLGAGNGKGFKLLKREQIARHLVDGHLRLQCILTYAETIPGDDITCNAYDKTLAMTMKIDNFMARTSEVVYSDVVATPFAQEVKWVIEVKPNQEDGWVKVYLCNSGDGPNKVTVKEEWSIVDGQNELFNRGRTKYKDYGTLEPGNGRGFDMIKRSNLSNFLTNGTLQLRCVLRYAERARYEVDMAKRIFTVRMDIENFTSRTVSIMSDTIKTDFGRAFEWNVQLYPFGKDDNYTEYVSLFLNSGHSSRNNVQVMDTWSVLDRHGNVVHERKTSTPSDFSIIEPSSGLGWSKFVKRSQLPEMLVEGTLKVQGVIKIIDENGFQEEAQGNTLHTDTIIDQIPHFSRILDFIG